MTPLESRPLRHWLIFAQATSIAAVVVSGLVLAGWLLDIAVFRSLLSVTATMKPAAVLCFILAGISLGLSRAGRLTKTRARAAGALALMAAMVGALTLGDYLYFRDLGSDALLVLALLATPNVVIFAAVVWLSARSLDQVDVERGRAERALRESEERFSMAFHSNPAGMVFQRLRDLHYMDVNESWLKLTGFQRDEVIGHTVDELGLISTESRVQLTKCLKEAGGFRDVELLVKTKQGDTRQALASAQTVMMDAEPHALAVLLDISERKRAEEARTRLEAQLRQSQKLQALGTLAAGIAHDFNNSLAVIVGNTRLTREDLPADHPVQQSLGEVYTAGVRASDLVGRILTFSRQQEARRRVVPLRPVVEEGLRLLRPMLPPRIEIHADFDPELPDVSIDPIQIQQVILNLGSNAADAMGEAGGRLELRASAITVSAEMAQESAELHEGRYALLAISDSGGGMDQEVLQRVFEPFFSTKPLSEGTGLGLSVVHGIMQAHDAAVTVHSEPGKGSTFRLYFPAAEAAAAEAQAGEIKRGRGEHVLYVDDEESLIFLVKRLLERLGYRVTGTTDAAQALETFQARPQDFDAVVTDLSMPGMSGMELATKLLQIRPDVPIVMASGFIRKEDVESAQRLGIEDLILKPNTVEELGQALHRLLGRRL